jgi:hypothetical protein
MRKPDYTFIDHGSVWLVQPETKRAQKHLREHVGPEAQWWASALVVEPRYAGQLSVDLQAAGFSVG